MKIELPFWMARELSTRFKGSIGMFCVARLLE